MPNGGRVMIVLFNPLSTTPGKQPLPLSVLSLAAVLEGCYPWTIVDGNLVADPASAIIEVLSRRPRSELDLLAVTVMPGPQLTQAVSVCRTVRESLPHLPIVWGGYFPTQHTDTVLRSSFVDYVVRSQGERPLIALLDVLGHGGGLGDVSGLSWKRDGQLIHNPIRGLAELNDLPDLPYSCVPMERYLHSNYLGRRTVAHNSSFGCPFACSFCAVVSMSNRRWLAQAPARMEGVLRHLVATYGVDAVQMHDMDFFISEARTAEFAERIAPLGISWWALGRIDTLMHYSDETWRRLARSGLRMVFSGAESASDHTLAAMNKGGRSAAHLALDLARRMREHGIVPEYSFVIGVPPDPLADLERTFEFIRSIKRINAATEIVLYTYTPVPMDGALYAEAGRHGFVFPASLDEWASDRWRQLMMRRGEGIPWIDDTVRRRIRNFERVLNAYYPTVTDRRLTPSRRALLRAVSAWRYRWRIYGAPYELRALHRMIRYQRPETTGF
jgi:anaerobic magnesium-protoporphyrin IX monomethyl ester cyclase